MAASGRLEGRVAFITGIARGQGRAHAVRLASEGAKIVGIDLAGPIPGVPYDSPTPADLAETVSLVEATGSEILAEIADVRDLDGMTAVVERGVERFGGLDVIVANAGVCIPSTWDQTAPEVFQNHIDTNVTGVWNTVIAGARHLVERGGGSVILISSYAGKKVQPFMVGYTASKHAVVGMTRAFAAELGKHSIRVNSIHPGNVNTPMGSGDMIGALTRAAETNPVLMNMGTPFLPRFSAEADEISSTVLFLASDDASFITAEHISVDGGAQYF
ncbi:mycofactocin-coupled SDR family oxidoreductase [Microbacterium gorillae]|uniref:mycofactocin-coupled SDR family oxidoreductase n=1 Tax=Microbacterium gorillae TaxID=1231063 RepID=UPI00058D7137|nr:mycofactocin-coupled SDR family oxidoreductase [Microbacterium gorillae]